MSDFTHEELKDIFDCLYYENKDSEDKHYDKLLTKIAETMEYTSVEKEIFSCHTGMAVSENKFAQQEFLTHHDLMPIGYQLFKMCEGKIKQGGIYGFTLRIMKLK